MKRNSVKEHDVIYANIACSLVNDIVRKYNIPEIDVVIKIKNTINDSDMLLFLGHSINDWENYVDKVGREFTSSSPKPLCFNRGD